MDGSLGALHGLGTGADLVCPDLELSGPGPRA